MLESKTSRTTAQNERLLESRRRTLVSKVGCDQAMVYAERDEAIVNGSARGRMAM